MSGGSARQQAPSRTFVRDGTALAKTSPVAATKVATSSAAENTPSLTVGTVRP